LQFMLHDENEAHEFADLNSAYAKAAQWKPDLLILGQDIVAARGLEVLQEIGARLPGAKIMLAMEAGQEAAARCYLEAGADGLLAKPLTVEGVRRGVDGVLGRRLTAG
jgi:DNA-binding NarL/FixJ family response regulator